MRPRRANRRRAPRTRRRLRCEICCDGKASPGIVLDVSSIGMFVQTAATIEPRSPVTVRFPPRDGRPGFEVHTRVARRRKVPQRLASLMPTGLGLELTERSPLFERLIEPAQEDPIPKPRSGPAPARNQKPYRVRVGQKHGPRSRSLVLRAESEEDALKRARSQIDSGWQILDASEE